MLCKLLSRLYYPFTAQCQLLTTMRKKPFVNIVGKGENAGYQHFLLFLQCFLTYLRKISLLSHIEIVCKCFQFGNGQDFVVL